MWHFLSMNPFLSAIASIMKATDIQFTVIKGKANFFEFLVASD